MPRVAVLVSGLALVLAGWVAVGWETNTNAQDASLAEHPIVGAWLLDVDADDPENPPALALFHDDGTYLQSDPDGSAGIGTWDATGESTADLTALFHDLDENDEFAGTAIVRATIEVADTGDTLTAEYTLDFVGPDGTSPGEFGPATATAERIAVEPMGEPVMSMAEALGGEAATPAP